MNDKCGLSKTKAESESDLDESANSSDLGFAKNCWNPTTFGFELFHKPRQKSPSWIQWHSVWEDLTQNHEAQKLRTVSVHLTDNFS